MAESKSSEQVEPYVVQLHNGRRHRIVPPGGKDASGVKVGDFCVYSVSVAGEPRPEYRLGVVIAINEHWRGAGPAVMSVRRCFDHDVETPSRGVHVVARDTVSGNELEDAWRRRGEKDEHRPGLIKWRPVGFRTLDEARDFVRPFLLEQQAEIGAARGHLEDGEVLRLDFEGHVVQWNKGDQEEYTSGESLGEFGIHNLSEHELARVGVTRAQWESAVSAHNEVVGILFGAADEEDGRGVGR